MSTNNGKSIPSLVDLPPTTHDFLLGSLSPQDLLAYAKISKKAKDIVNAFYRRAYRPEHIFSRYFEPDEIRRFRILQHAIGFVISGSSALTFFSREPPYPNSDLDVYIDKQWCAMLLHFLDSHGYVYQPIVTDTKHQANDVYIALDEALLRQDEGDWNGHPGFLGGEQHYFFTQITDVFNFVRDGKKIQVIACRATPLEVILDFHSNNIAVVNNRRNVDQDAALDKYRQRGWEVVKTVDALRGLGYRSDISYLDYRHVGDSLCWTISLNPVRDFAQSHLTLGDLDNYTINSWGFQHCFNKVEFTTLPVPGLEQSYCLPCGVWCKVRDEEILKDIQVDRASAAQALKNLVYKHLRPNRSPDEPREVCRRMVVRAFEDGRKQFPSVPMDKLPPLRAGSIVWSYIRSMLENLKTQPKVAINFKRDRQGAVWTYITIEKMPKMITLSKNDYDLKMERVKVEVKRYPFL
ncbi:hypothetical protein VNI00_009851 [Paramarasmius palmivorus]|uniref:F-box domain-containing protein n=1 Tax=Paramarasmius palmivorus TaxID=297713 RepID=A0AAW0CNC2_9AGAR